MLYLCGYADSLTLVHWLDATIAGKKLRVLSLLNVPWHIAIKRTNYETIDFHRGRPVSTVGWKNYTCFPGQAMGTVHNRLCTLITDRVHYRPVQNRSQLKTAHVHNRSVHSKPCSQQAICITRAWLTGETDVIFSVPIQNRPVHNRPFITDHSKQTTFTTDPFITDLLKTDHFHNRPCS